MRFTCVLACALAVWMILPGCVGHSEGVPRRQVKLVEVRHFWGPPSYIYRPVGSSFRISRSPNYVFTPVQAGK